VTLVLGVDGGNSKAIALVARTDGTILGAARALGAADIYAAPGEAAALALVRHVADEALASAGATAAEIEHAAFSMAGADWPEDFALLRTAFEAVGSDGAPVVVNDAIGALHGAVPEGPAVVVSIGTGAATGARGSGGRTWHSSFWQSPQGAHELAQRSLRAVVRSELGIEPPTRLRQRLLAITGDGTVEAVLHRFTARATPRPPTGPIVRALLEEAAAGDPGAVEVVRAHGAGLGAVAAAAARRVGIDGAPFALSFCGGLVRSGAPLLIEAATDAVRATGQTPIAVAPRWEPAVGALVIGLTGSAGSLSADVAGRLDASAPPPSFYDVPED
jgi:N-acetylglucosamine kinase-like BadF-type ATPase